MKSTHSIEAVAFLAWFMIGLPIPTHRALLRVQHHLWDLVLREAPCGSILADSDFDY